MLCLYLEAPFAVCRTFTAGWYRPTATFLTPSAAYGLLLNVAGIESRLREEEADHDNKTPASLMRTDLPACRLALGVPSGAKAKPRLPHVQSLYQQLHNYPVGTSGKERAASTKGNKYNITPVRRDVLTELRAFLVLDDNAELEERVRQGLRGELNAGRYGLPFVGDNMFLPDRLEECPLTESDDPIFEAVHWYERLDESANAPHPDATRLTIWIDRADMSRTRSATYAPGNASPFHGTIPNNAWTRIEPPSST